MTTLGMVVAVQTETRPFDARRTEVCEADAIAGRCRELLAAIAAQGGPAPDEHLEQVRRLLARRGHPLDRARRSRLASALLAAAGGPGTPGRSERELRSLVRDLRAVERVLREVARIGAAAALPSLA